MKLSEVHKSLTKKKIITSSVQYLHKLVKEGKIPYTGEGRKKQFKEEEVIQALKDLSVRPSAEPKNTKEHLEALPTPRPDQSPEEYQEEVQARLGVNPSLADARTFLTIYQGKTAQQKFDIEAGKLVYREEVEQKAFLIARVVRDQMLTLPERLSGEMASYTDPKVIKEILYKEINDILMYLHKGEALYDD